MKEINLLEVGIRVRNQRETLGMTREQLSEKIGVSSKFLMDIENGVKGFSLKTLSRLSDILYLNTDYILFGEKDDNDILMNVIKKCPKDSINSLISIVAIFIDEINKD